MKISLKWLSKYVQIPDVLRKVPELCDMLTKAGLEVEGVQNAAKDFANVYVGQILEKRKHENSDRLSVCIVSTGEKTHQIVCGAQNHNQGDKVVVSLPGAVLPGNFEIKNSKIRGVESGGMLCSEKELGLPSTIDGIMILPQTATVGEEFAKYQKLDDVILDIKVTPNRADCLSHMGLAREIGALMGRPVEFPTTPLHEGRESTRKLIKVVVEDGERTPRYCGRMVKGVKVGPSPDWMVKFLESTGLRSINNIVDITNFVMLELGQPLHAFDVSQIAGNQIVVRSSRPGEVFETLDAKKLTLDGSELVIADGEKAVALAGVMGGINSGISEKTTDVFIESAFFVPWTVRRTSRRHGLDTDSSYRFSRGVDPDGVFLAMNRASQLMAEFAGGTVCADHYDIYPRPVTRPRIELDLVFISARLGVSIESAEAKKILEKLGCDVSGSGNKLLVNPPAFRADLKLAEDLGEEIIRMMGFENIPEKVPNLTAPPTTDARDYVLENRMANSLINLGLSQAVNFNLLSQDGESKFWGENRGNSAEIGLDLKLDAIKIANPLNLELSGLRTSILFNLLKSASHNVRHSRKSGGLFEIAPVFFKKATTDPKGEKPFSESQRLGIVLWSDGKKQDWMSQAASVSLFFNLKGVLESVFASWGIRNSQFEILKNPIEILHPGQSAAVIVEGKSIGFIGTLHPGKAEAFALDMPVAVCELDLGKLFQGQPRNLKVKPISKFPVVERDVAFLAPKDLAAGAISKELKKACGPLAVSVDVFDVFEGGSLPPDQRSLAFRIVYQDMQKTLSNDEINALHQKAVSSLSEKLKISLR